MNDSALRDIIPSEDTESLKKFRRSQCSRICKVLLFTIFLGFIALGIVTVVFVLGYSGKSLAYFFMQPRTNRLLKISNSTETSSKHIMKTITLKRSNDHESNDISPSSTIKPNQENLHTSTNASSTKFHIPTTTMINEQATSQSIEYEVQKIDQDRINTMSKMIKNQEDNESLQNTITPDDIPTSTFPMSTMLDHDIVTSEAVLLSTLLDLQSSANQSNETNVLNEA